MTYIGKYIAGVAVVEWRNEQKTALLGRSIPMGWCHQKVVGVVWVVSWVGPRKRRLGIGWIVHGHQLGTVRTGQN